MEYVGSVFSLRVFAGSTTFYNLQEFSVTFWLNHLSECQRMSHSYTIVINFCLCVEAVMSTLSIGASLLLPPLRERTELLHSLLPQGPESWESLSKGQVRKHNNIKVWHIYQYLLRNPCCSSNDLVILLLQRLQLDMVLNSLQEQSHMASLLGYSSPGELSAGLALPPTPDRPTGSVSSGSEAPDQLHLAEVLLKTLLLSIGFYTVSSTVV